MTTVSITRVGTDVDAAFALAMERAGCTGIIKPGNRVVIKPNWNACAIPGSTKLVTVLVLRRVEPLGYLLADAVLVNSDAVRRDVEKTERFWEGKIRRIYNGIEAAPPDDLTIEQLVPELSGRGEGRNNFV